MMDQVISESETSMRLQAIMTGKTTRTQAKKTGMQHLLAETRLQRMMILAVEAGTLLIRTQINLKILETTTMATDGVTSQQPYLHRQTILLLKKKAQ